ncbi:MAG: DUF4010 domain-containing protein [Candidatus Peribacteria bacterium]|nr:MAG: DUF4010 domain-containing protein [Candidatus Peribacteria bacterium]
MSFASEYGALITYFIGVFVMLGSMEFAIIFAVLLTLLLSLKDYISSFKTKVSRDELIDTLKFAVIAFVILPLLPDDRYSFAMIASTFGGTEISVWDNAIWQLQFLNPHGIWFFVVAMSAIGYIGYIFTKILGKKSGVIISSVLGGLVSSTAVTAAMAEKSRRYTLNNSLYVLGTLIASCIMFLRVIFIIILFNVALLTDIAVPSLMMFGVLVGVAIYFYLKSK